MGNHLTQPLPKPSIGNLLYYLVDLGGSLAVASKGFFATGLTTDLNVTYMRSGGRVGDILRAEALCDRIGKKLAFTSIRFFDGKEELVAKGSHTK